MGTSVHPTIVLYLAAFLVVGLVLLTRFELPWLLTLVVGGAVYLAGLALTRAIPRDLLVSVLRRRRVAYQGSV